MSKQGQLMKLRFLLALIVVMFVSTLIIPLITVNFPTAHASGFSDSFDDNSIDTALWDTLIVGTGSVSEASSDFLVTQTLLDGDASGLVSKISYDLSSSNISVYAIQNTAPIILLCISNTKNTVLNPWSNADDWYAMMLYTVVTSCFVYERNGGGNQTNRYGGTWSASAETFRIEIEDNTITFFEGSTQRYQEAYDLPSNDCYITLYSMTSSNGTLQGKFDDFVLTQTEPPVPPSGAPFYSGFENAWYKWMNRTGSDNNVTSLGSIFNGTFVYTAEKDSYIRTDPYTLTAETLYLDVHVMFNGTFVDGNKDWFAQFGWDDTNYINLGVYANGTDNLHWAITRSNSSSVGISTAEQASLLVWYNVTLGITHGHPANVTLWVDNVWVAAMNIPDDFSELFNYALIGIYDADDTNLNFRYDDISISSERSTSWLRILEPLVYASSGYPDDVQDAIEEIESLGGGIVSIPAGHFDWNGETVTIDGTFPLSIVGASRAGCRTHTSDWESYTATTILHNNVLTANEFFEVGGQSHGAYQMYAVDFSNIQFETVGPPNPTTENSIETRAIYLRQILGFRISYCTFVNFTSSGIMIDCNDGWGEAVNVSSYGVVDHCVFTAPYKLTQGVGDFAWSYGITVGGNADSSGGWDNNGSNFRGKYEFKLAASIVYIEDCHFSNSRHAMASTSGGYYIARYNKLDTPACAYSAGGIDVHGPTVDVDGGYGGEFYNNTIVGTPLNLDPWGGTYWSIGIDLRGGKTIVFNNTFTCATNSEFNKGVLLVKDYVEGKENQQVLETYIWDNVVTGAIQIDDGSCIEDTEYFLRAPSFALDGFDYVPYSYPMYVDYEDASLTVNSNPPGIAFTFDGENYTTNKVFSGATGVHTIIFPASVQVGSPWYNFSAWENSSTNRTRVIDVTESETITATYTYFMPAGFVPLVDDFNGALDTAIWTRSYTPDVSYFTTEYSYANFTILNPSGSTNPNFIYTINTISFEDVNIQVDKVFHTNTANDYAYFCLGGTSPWELNSIYLELGTGYGGSIALIGYNSSGRYYLSNTAPHPNFAQLGLRFVSSNHSVEIYENGERMLMYALGPPIPSVRVDWFWSAYPSGNATFSLGLECQGLTVQTGVCFDNLFTYYGSHNSSLMKTVSYAPALTNFAFMFPEPFPIGAIDKTYFYLPDMNISTAVVQKAGFIIDSYTINSTTVDVNSTSPISFFLTTNSSYKVTIVMSILSTYRLLNITADGYGIRTSPIYGAYAYLTDTELDITKSFVLIDPPGAYATFDGWYVDMVLSTNASVHITMSNNVTVETRCHLDNPSGSWFYRAATMPPYMVPDPPYGGYYFHQILDEIEALNDGNDLINYISIRASYYYNATTGKMAICTLPRYNILGYAPWVEVNPSYPWEDYSQGLVSGSPEQLHLAVDQIHAHGMKVYVVLEQSLETPYSYPIDYLDTDSIRAFLANYRDNVVYPYAALFEGWDVDDMGLSIEMQWDGGNPSTSISGEHPLGEPILTECNDLWTEIIMGVRDRFSGRITQQYTMGYQQADINVFKNASYFNYLDYIMLDEWQNLDVNGSVFTSLDTAEAWRNSYSGTNILELNKDLADYFGKKIVINCGFPNRFGSMPNPWSQYGTGQQFRHDLTQYCAWQGSLWAFEGQGWFGGFDLEGYNSIYADISEDNYTSGEFPQDRYRISWRATAAREMIFEELLGMLLSEPPVPLGLAVYLTIGSSPYGSANLSVGVHAYYRGDIVVLLATPDNSSWRWAYWFINVGTKRNTNPISVTMNRNYTYTPTFVSTATSNVTGAMMSYLPYLLFIAGVGIAIILIRGKRE